MLNMLKILNNMRTKVGIVQAFHHKLTIDLGLTTRLIIDRASIGQSQKIGTDV